MSSVKDLTTQYRMEQLEKENEALKQELAVFKLNSIQISNEEIICIQQIKVLHDRSLQRELSLEEVKKLDLLVKNLRLIQNKTDDNANSANFRDVTETQLVAIASQSESKD